MPPIWIVWRDGGGSPSKQHLYQADARAEAKRLSEKNLGATFHVFECVHDYTVTCEVQVKFVEELR